MQLTGGEILAEYLIAEGVPYVLSIPGHGDVAMLDALVDRKDRIQARLAMHEQSLAHIADAYYRVSGQPLAVYTSIGPGALNTAIGVGQAYSDSTAMLLVTGSVHTYMKGHSVLQEIDRQHWADFISVMRPLVKQSWQVESVRQVPFVLQRAFNQMLSGRPGPVHIDLPMDVQAETADVTIPEPTRHHADTRVRPDPRAIERAARLLLAANRPVILLGGGVITAEAGPLALRLAEHIGAAITTTWNGKGAVPEDHDLYAWHPGSPGSTCANELCHDADVLLAVGCRFTDWSSSSYHRDMTFQIPPSQLIHIDIDEREIGKNYPAAVGLVADAREALADLLAAVREQERPLDYHESAYFAEIVRRREAWYEMLRPAQTYDGPGVTVSQALVAIRAALPRNGIVVTGAGLPQNQTYQEFPVYEPRTSITSGGFSTMGFTMPGAIGAKLARPEVPVVGIAGDGDFLATVQELATAIQYGNPIVYVVLNNQGWSSIRTLQESAYGSDRRLITEFQFPDGTPYSPNLAEVARGFGAYGVRVSDVAALGREMADALRANEGVHVIEVMTTKHGLTKAGWWDVPVPAYLTDRRAEYERMRDGEVVR